MNWDATPNLDVSTARAIREARESGAFQGKLAHSSLRSLLRGYATEFDRQTVHSRIARHQLREALGAGEPFAPARLRSSGLAIGQRRDGRWLFQGFNQLSGHWVVVGSTGSGKSSLAVPWLAQLVTVEGGVWVFDSYKQEARRLLPLAAAFGHDVVVLRAGDERINVLDPDGCDPRGYLPIVTYMLARVLGLPPLATMLLQRALYLAYELRGVWRGASSSPCLIDLYEMAKSGLGDANYSARETLLARLSSLLTVCVHTRALRRGWPSKELESLKLVRELGNASQMERELGVLHALRHTMQRRIESQATHAPLHLVIDDSQRFLTGSAESSELTPLAEALGLVRSSGLNLWALCQSLTGVDPAILANLNNKIVGRLGSASDWNRAASELFLTKEQEEWARRHLGPGVFLAQLAQGWRRPFVLRMPKAKIPPPPSDEEVLAGHAALARFPIEEAAEYKAWSPVPHLALDAAIQATDAAEAPKAAAHAGLDEAALRFLAVVHDHPAQPSSAYPALAGLSPKRARPIRDRLIEEGYLRSAEVQTTTRGRPSVLLELSVLGLDALRAWRGTGGAP
ncbi:MAG: hypothetical protein IT432_04165 [Phycisphaerales bacterium]|nr:hypothetical protein [Phycisphaerales bacterium]